MIRFTDGAWSATLPDIEIFDARFIYDNVYAGECVEHEQRRNLYDVIIGEQGVKLVIRLAAVLGGKAVGIGRRRAATRR